MKQMTEHKLLLKRFCRKVSQNILMTLGTMSLLVVVTGLSANLPRSNAWTFVQPSPISKKSAHLYQCMDNESSLRYLKSILDFRSNDVLDCDHPQEAHAENEAAENHG